MLFNKRCCCGQQHMAPMYAPEPRPMMECCERPMDCCNRPLMEGPLMEGPVMEPVTTKFVEKEIYHEVPHCCPVHTKVINKHIYTHTYTPQYSCSEENVVINSDCGGCGGY